MAGATGSGPVDSRRGKTARQGRPGVTRLVPTRRYLAGVAGFGVIRHGMVGQARKFGRGRSGRGRPGLGFFATQGLEITAGMTGVGTAGFVDLSQLPSWQAWLDSVSSSVLGVEDTAGRSSHRLVRASWYPSVDLGRTGQARHVGVDGRDRAGKDG